MKILYLSNSIIPSRSANSIHVMKMCNALSKNKHQVTLIAPSRENYYENNINNIFSFYGVKKSFEVKKLWYPDIRGGVLFYILSIFVYLILNRQFEVVYSRFLHGCYVALFAGNEVYFEAHTPIYKESFINSVVFKRIIKSKKFKKLIVISNALKKKYLKKKFLSKDLIQVAHDGADKRKKINKKKKLLGIEGKLKIGYVGHLYKGKGIEIIESVSNKLNDTVEFHVIGGTEQDLEYWKKRINKKNVFFYGFVPPKNVSKYIDAIDICILPNQKIVYAYGTNKNGFNISEFTSPLKLFEYMAHKKAIISSNLPVLKEVLNKKNSILVDYSNINGWINSIKKLQDPKRRKKLGNQAFKDLDKYSWITRANNILKFQK